MSLNKKIATTISERLSVVESQIQRQK